MPNSKSMNEFAKRVHRLRYHSQCAPEIDRSDDGYLDNNGKLYICGMETFN